jgi:hypothetical protein
MSRFPTRLTIMTISFASASDTENQKARVVELAAGVYGYISDFDPNCGFIVGDDAVLVSILSCDRRRVARCLRGPVCTGAP